MKRNVKPKYLKKEKMLFFNISLKISSETFHTHNPKHNVTLC